MGVETVIGMRIENNLQHASFKYWLLREGVKELH